MILASHELPARKSQQVLSPAVLPTQTQSAHFGDPILATSIL